MVFLDLGHQQRLPLPLLLPLQVALRGLGSVVAVEERSLTGTWDVRMLQRWHWSTKTGHLKGLGVLAIPARLGNNTDPSCAGWLRVATSPL